MFRYPPQARVTGEGRVSAPHEVILTLPHHCRHCGWEGPGQDLKTGEVHEGSGIVDYNCPRCQEWIAFSYPLVEWGPRSRASGVTGRCDAVQLAAQPRRQGIAAPPPDPLRAPDEPLG